MTVGEGQARHVEGTSSTEAWGGTAGWGEWDPHEAKLLGDTIQGWEWQGTGRDCQDEPSFRKQAHEVSEEKVGQWTCGRRPWWGNMGGRLQPGWT